MDFFLGVQLHFTINLFKIVQNKLHYAAHGHIAAEIIYERVDAEKTFMGLKLFRCELPALKDSGITKNYLNASELKVMNHQWTNLMRNLF